MTFSETFLVFLMTLVVFFGVNLVFENPVCVKEMTNMRYDAATFARLIVTSHWRVM